LLHVRIAPGQGASSSPQLALAPKTDPMATHYDVIGVPRTASAAELRAAYKKAALACHLDKHSGADGGSRG